MYRNHELLGLARLLPRCMSCDAHNYGQVVAAHRNEGKGMGMKCPDFMWAGMCDKCHAFLDHGAALSREDRRTMWNDAYWKTQEWLWTAGHLVASVESVAPPAPKPKVKRSIAKGAGIASRPFEKPANPKPWPKRSFPKRSKG